MIELDGVSKSYGGAVVLDPLNLRLRPGQTTVLIGPSGCGKSTLLRLIMGLVRADTGSITIDGEALTAATALSIRRKLGYVIQDGGLFPHLSARENVTLLARHLGWKASAIDKRLAELAELSRLPVDALDRFPSQLSGGQRQRVGLMRALFLDPRVILLDEPLGALDPMVRAELQDDLRSVFRALKKTVVMVTHDLAEAAWFGDELVLLRAGKVIQRSSFAAMLEAPADAFVTQFVRAQRRVYEFTAGGEGG
jgi:osmoprotectant transport system ATP-binding protein